MSLGLYSRCMGGNSTTIAMDFWPEESPTSHAPTVKVPTLMAQLRRDFLIDAEKELFWLEGSNQRFSAYNYFG